MLNKIVNNIRNRIGWSTNRHIIVFESDDWGSVRTRSLKDRNEMEAAGLDMQSSIFPKYDSLESNDDLERLFDLLMQHKDSTGRPPVFTPMCVMANADFEKIANSDFSQYHYEPFPETCKRYPNHDRVVDLWHEGTEKRLFVPALHAREHFNVKRWMQNLQRPDSPMRIAFWHQSLGASLLTDGTRILEYLGAFYSQDKTEYHSLENIALDACRLFADICGYTPTHFIGPNIQPVKNTYCGLVEGGVRYITNAKNCLYPIGDGKFQRELNWLGKYNKEFGYTNICRNGGFEQVNPAHDYVNECLFDIEQAFKFHKPCVISSHRVNYIGGVEESNATNGLHKLDDLLNEIEKRWPDVEYMTSTELGDLMTSKRYNA